MSLSEVGSVCTNSEMSVTESEALHDACRAYGLLLHSSQLRQIPEHEEISSQVHIHYKWIIKPSQRNFKLELKYVRAENTP